MNKILKMGKSRIPERTAERLSLYRRILGQMQKEGKEITSSYEIGQRGDILDSQVRKDFSFFGQFGTAGRGYKIGDLKSKLAQIIGKDQTWRMVIVGVGNLASALLGYPQFKKEGFEIVAAFDSDVRKIGKLCGGMKIEDVNHLREVAHKKKVDIGIITVPVSATQEVANSLVKAGIKAILNFAPCRLKIPQNVKALNVDICLRLEVLTQFLSTKAER